MLNNVLSKHIREQAGANSYNRFEYQVHWIVYHMIKEFKQGREFLIFCEFHDDMAKSQYIDKPDCLEFFQIKTSETKKEWKIKDLFKIDKKSHSFLGFLFYNFANFSNECKKCHFVSNVEPDKKILDWQSLIEDGKILKNENIELYNEIRDTLKIEFIDVKEDIFVSTYDRFIQNTYVYYGNLPLQQYEKILLGEFSELLGDKNIYVSSSNKILKDIIEDVRKKSKTKIKTPISLKSLKEKKGISSDVFRVIQESIDEFPNKEKLYEEIEELLKEIGYSKIYYRNVTRRLRTHHSKLLNISNTLYIDNCTVIYSLINRIISEYLNKMQDINRLKDIFVAEYGKVRRDISDEIDEVLLEAMLYEKLLSK